MFTVNKTGKEIFEEIKKAVEEQNEIGEGLAMIADNLGYECVTYSTLEKVLKEADKRVDKLLKQEYKIINEVTSRAK